MVMFSQASVCPQGGGVHSPWRNPLPGRHPHRADTRPGQTPLPISDGHCRGRYASYWNAFLFNFSYQFSMPSWYFSFSSVPLAPPPHPLMVIFFFFQFHHDFIFSVFRVPWFYFLPFSVPPRFYFFCFPCSMILFFLFSVLQSFYFFCFQCHRPLRPSTEGQMSRSSWMNRSTWRVMRRMRDRRPTSHGKYNQRPTSCGKYNW